MTHNINEIQGPSGLRYSLFFKAQGLVPLISKLCPNFVEHIIALWLLQTSHGPQAFPIHLQNICRRACIFINVRYRDHSASKIQRIHMSAWHHKLCELSGILKDSTTTVLISYYISSSCMPHMYMHMDAVQSIAKILWFSDTCRHFRYAFPAFHRSYQPFDSLHCTRMCLTADIFFVSSRERMLIKFAPGEYLIPLRGLVCAVIFAKTDRF